MYVKIGRLVKLKLFIYYYSVKFIDMMHTHQNNKGK